MNKRFKILIVAMAAATLCPLQAQEKSITDASGAVDLRRLLQEALFEEEGTRDLEKAAKSYEALLTGYRDQKQLAATALFRLAEVRRKQGRNADAIPLYQQLLADFPAIEPLAKMSRENLGALGAKESGPAATAPSGGPATPAADDEEERELQRLQTLARSSPDLLHAFNPQAGESNFTPLNQAAGKGQLRAAAFLLEHGAVINPATGTTPLQLAAENGHKAMCELLLAKGADMNAMGPGSSALHLATAKNRIAVVRLLLEKGADANAVSQKPLLPQALNLSGLAFRRHLGTPLHIAMHFGFGELIDLLLERKADVRIAQPDSSLTALHFAAERGHAKLVRRLLELGADAKAATSEHPDQRGSDVPGGVTALHFAASAGCIECVQLLLDAGAPVDARGGPQQQTALHLGASGGGNRPDIVRLLLGAKADVNAADEQGQTALHLAAQAREADPVCRLLLEAGASVDARDKNSRTPLAVAGSAEVATLLLDRGADPEAKDFQGSVAFLANPALNNSAARVPLMRRIRYPKLAAADVISLSLPEIGYHWELARSQGSDQPPHLAEALLGWNVSVVQANKQPNWKAPTIFRQKPDGQFEEIQIDLTALGDFPVLRWGDIIEVLSDDPRSPKNISTGGGGLTQWAFPNDVRAGLRARLTRTVSLALGDQKQTVTLLGRLVVYDPSKAEAPLATLGPLLRLLGRDAPEFATSPAIVRRAPKKGGGVTTIGPGNQAEALTVEDGDEIEVEVARQTDAAWFRRSGITLLSPPAMMSWRLEVKTENRHQPDAPGSSEPTLLQLLATYYAPISAETVGQARGTPSLDIDKLSPEDWARVVLEAQTAPRSIIPHPNWAEVRIRRLKDDGADEVIAVDLAKAIAACGPDTPAEKAAAADVDLRAGDIVELPISTDRTGEAWIGFDEATARFFTKALSCRVTVVQQDTFKEVAVEYFPPRFVSTSAGLLVVPREGLMDGKVSDLKVFALAQSLRLPPENFSNLVRAEFSEFKPVHQIYLRPGDRLDVTGMGAAIPFRQPGVPARPVGQPLVPRRRVITSPNQTN